MNWAQQGFNAVFVFVLAALLGPEAFGTVAIAIIFVGLVQILVELGLSLPLIQRHDLTHDHEDSVTWALSLWAFLIIGLAISVGPFWARWNDAQLVGSIILALAPTVLLHAVCLVPKSRMIRSLRFRPLTLVTACGSLLGGTAGVAAALRGADVWALVIQQWVTIGLTTVLIWCFAGYRPRFFLSWRCLKDLLPVASGSLSSQLGSYVQGRLDSILVSLFFGPVAVGLYRLSHRIIQLILALLSRPLRGFALPYLAQRHQDIDAFRRGTVKCLAVSTILVVPVMGIVGALSPLIALSIGKDWHQAWVAIAFFSVVGVVHSFVLFTPQILNAAGRSHVAAGITWISVAVGGSSFVLAGIFVRNAPLIEQLAVVSATRAAVALLFSLPFHMLIVKWITGLTLRELADAIAIPLACGALGTLVAGGFLVLDPLGGMHALIRLVVYGTASYFVASVALCVLDQRVRGEFIRAKISLAAYRATNGVFNPKQKATRPGGG